jgi:hypothetical protein
VLAEETESSKAQDDASVHRHQKFDYAFRRDNIGRAYFERMRVCDTYPSRPTRKRSDDELVDYFNQMRINPRARDTASKDMDMLVVPPLPSSSSDPYRGYERESPATSTPNETDGSVSEESLATSSANTLNSVNGGVSNNVPEKNRVVLERIKTGLDKRTTVMIKNVPNKYTQVYLVHGN